MASDRALVLFRRTTRYSIREIFNPRGISRRWNWPGQRAYTGFLTTLLFVNSQPYESLRGTRSARRRRLNADRTLRGSLAVSADVPQCRHRTWACPCRARRRRSRGDDRF